MSENSLSSMRILSQLLTKGFPFEQATILTAAGGLQAGYYSKLDSEWSCIVVLWNLLEYLSDKEVEALARMCSERQVQTVLVNGDADFVLDMPLYNRNDCEFYWPTFLSEGYSTYDPYHTLSHYGFAMEWQGQADRTCVLVRPGAIGFSHHAALLLRQNGWRVLECEWHGLPQYSRTPWALSKLKPDVVIVSALAVPFGALSVVASAAACPVICDTHSDFSYLAMESLNTLEKFGLYCRTAQDDMAIVMASPREQTALMVKAAIGNAIHLPNPYVLPSEMPKRRSIGEHLHVGLMSRYSSVKNMPGQLFVLSIFAQQHKNIIIHLLNNPDIVRIVKPIPCLRSVVYHKWTDVLSFRQSMDIVDIGMQVSFSETFNYVSLDHACCGAPCLCCPDIEHVQSKLRVPPTDYKAMLHSLGWCVDNYERASKEALSVARQTSVQQNDKFLSTIDAVIDSYAQSIPD